MDLVSSPSRSTLALRGLANIILGGIVVLWPSATLYVLIVLFSLNLMFVGLFAIFEPLFDRSNHHSILTVILGILGVIVGIFLIARPEIAASIVSLLIAFWALLFGIADLYAGFAVSDAKSKAPAAWFLILIGIISLIFGVYVLFNPITGAITFVWLVGLYALIVGVILVVASFFVKSSKKSNKK